MDMKPLIAIIDLDGTIIGDCSPQACYNEIFSFLQSIYYDNPNDIDVHIEKALSKGLIRSSFVAFFKNIKQTLPHTEFFIFTASEISWATKIINAIEKLTAVTFNRPIFSRANCVKITYKTIPYQKNIKHILPIIQNVLQDKYQIGDLCSLYDSIMIIDDNPLVYAQEDLHKVICCPKYKYIYPLDFLELFPKSLTCQYYKSIASILKTHQGHHYSSESIKRHKSFLAQYRKNILKTKISYTQLSNVDDRTFWKDIEEKIINMNV